MRSAIYIFGVMLAESLGVQTGWNLPKEHPVMIALLFAVFFSLDLLEVTKK